MQWACGWEARIVDQNPVCTPVSTIEKSMADESMGYFEAFHTQLEVETGMGFLFSVF
jgi:hypothetical protein